jgi:hypothetical protein
LKLAYIFLGGSLSGSSVQSKIICQITELRNNGFEAEGWFFSPSIQEKVSLNEFITIHPLKPYKAERNYFNNYYENQFYYGQINEYISANDVDCIFLRHGASGTEYFKLLKKHADKLFLYIPSNTIGENFSERKHAPPSGLLGMAFRWWEYFRYFYIYEKQLIRKYLPLLKSVVVFTPEFGRILNAAANRKINIIYNRDGADCQSVKLRTPEYNSEKIKLLFMKGSSMQQPWSGLERLMRSIERQESDLFELYITGNVVEKELYDKPFVKLTGRLSNEELEQLVNEVDLGVSNLANYMIGFNETTNLKSRDYYARGLPFIQANTMPDIDGTDAQRYYLLLPNNDTDIDVQRVYDFALSMRKDKFHAGKMRFFAEKNLDWKVTVAELGACLKNALHE